MTGGMVQDVLVVDRDPRAAEFTKTVIEDVDGLQAVAANEEESALAYARKRRPGLVVLSSEGQDFLRCLRGDNATALIPVVLLANGSGTAPDIEAAACSKQGTEIILHKPVNPKTLKAAVTHLLGLQ